ncbi:MAG TPA: hypothetical protein VJJ82_05495 [Candidatus Nanoarchaeia archaeon]|nr:hypothetical protein [Candidatus Nanoarchaeia archaeon]
MNLFDILLSQVSQTLDRLLPEIAAGVAENLRRNMETLGGTDCYTPLLREMNLIDGTGKVTDSGRKMYGLLQGYYAEIDEEEMRGQAEQERKARLRTLPGYITQGGQFVPPTLYDPNPDPETSPP